MALALRGKKKRTKRLEMIIAVDFGMMRENHNFTFRNQYCSTIFTFRRNNIFGYRLCKYR